MRSPCPSSPGVQAAEGLRPKPPGLLVRSTFAACLALAGGTAWAHHGEGMRVPATLYAGVLSGVAHPVLDLAHFGFLLALAVLALRSAQPLRLLAIFLAAVLVGAGAHLAGIEPLEGQGLAGWMAATALLGGLVIALPPRGRPSAIAASIALAVAGLLHGSGYAESVEGASLPVLAAYFTGVFVVQSAIALAGVQALRLAATKGRLDVGEGALASIALVCGGVAMTMAIAA